MHALGLALAAAITTRLATAGDKVCCGFAADFSDLLMDPDVTAQADAVELPLATECRANLEGVSFAVEYFALLRTCAFES